jgi:hypothetical protein
MINQNYGAQTGRFVQKKTALQTRTLFYICIGAILIRTKKKNIYCKKYTLKITVGCDLASSLGSFQAKYEEESEVPPCLQ